jgi:hypothetical protein
VPKSKPAPPTAAELEAAAQAQREAEARAEAQAQEDRLAEALWYGTVDGEAFDGDPADLW